MEGKTIDIILTVDQAELLLEIIADKKRDMVLWHRTASEEELPRYQNCIEFLKLLEAKIKAALKEHGQQI